MLGAIMSALHLIETRSTTPARCCTVGLIDAALLG
jgi:hypothetical protein